jgi:hypothetical protein
MGVSQDFFANITKDFFVRAVKHPTDRVSADLYNRQLHPEEKTQAQKIADDAKARGITNPDGSAITVDQIENAMRYADNKQYGEFSTSGVAVPLNSNTPASAVYDTANMQLTNDSSGSYLVQDLSSVAPPSTTLQSLIQQETGGANSPYTWGTYSSGSPSGVPSAASGQAGVYQDANGQYRQRITIGGDTFDIGLNGTCGTAECSAFGSNINWNDQGSKQLQQAINTGLATTISNTAAIVSFGWPTGFVGAAAGYVGLAADAANAKLQGSFAPLATDIVGVPMQIYLHGLGMADSSASGRKITRKTSRRSRSMRGPLARRSRQTKRKTCCAESATGPSYDRQGLAISVISRSTGVPQVKARWAAFRASRCCAVLRG